MTKRIIKDYFTAFRWSRVRETFANEQWWLFFYFLFCLPIACRYFDTRESTLAYLMVNIPFVFTLFAAPLHPAALPKLLYLCPMSKEMRKEYIVKACYIRVGFPILIGIACGIILLWQGICDWICGVGILLNLVILAVIMGSGINKNGCGKKLENGQRAMDMDTKKGIYEAACLILAFLVSLTYASILAWETSVAIWVKCLPLGVILLIQLPITLKYLSYWQESVENAAYYESSISSSK